MQSKSIICSKGLPSKIKLKMKKKVQEIKERKINVMKEKRGIKEAMGNGWAEQRPS